MIFFVIFVFIGNCAGVLAPRRADAEVGVELPSKARRSSSSTATQVKTKLSEYRRRPRRFAVFSLLAAFLCTGFLICTGVVISSAIRMINEASAQAHNQTATAP